MLRVFYCHLDSLDLIKAKTAVACLLFLCIVYDCLYMLFMATLCNRAGCYIFALWFLSFFLYLFSLPNLSGRRLDVCRTSTHGVALVRIWNAGLKCAACPSLEIQDAKNHHFGTITQLCRAICSQLMHVWTIGKKTC